MSTFDPTQHPRGNAFTGHAGQFATKQQSNPELTIQTLDERFSESTGRSAIPQTIAELTEAAARTVCEDRHIERESDIDTAYTEPALQALSFKLGDDDMGGLPYERTLTELVAAAIRIDREQRAPAEILAIALDEKAGQPSDGEAFGPAEARAASVIRAYGEDAQERFVDRLLELVTEQIGSSETKQ